MRAMVMTKQCGPLRLAEVAVPGPGANQVQIKISACAVCRTDLHVIDTDLTNPKLPLVPGHEIIGRVSEVGANVKTLKVGDRVGIPWLGWTCGKCEYCRSGRENLCEQAKFTGYTLDGGYAEYTVADARFCFPIPEVYSDAEAAPLLCAGLIGYRSYVKTGSAKRIGIYGFGAAAHIITQVARHEDKEVFAFTRAGDEAGQRFAKSLGAVWAGDSRSLPPKALDAAIIFAPVGELVPRALRSVSKGGVVVCAGIHMSDIPSFPYRILWEERSICSVANLTREDGVNFFKIASQVPIRTHVRTFPLFQANDALAALREGKIKGAAVMMTSL